MHILVTGANGYIGQNLTRHLIAQGHEVSSMTRKPIEGDHSFKSTLVHEFASRNPLPSLQGFDAIVHLAGWVHKDDDLEKHQAINRDGSIRLAQKASEDGVQKFLFMSTVAVHGYQSEQPFTAEATPNPITSYGQSKWEAEEGIKQFDLDWVMLRPPMVYGPGAPGNFQIVEKIVRRNFPVPFAAVEEKRNFIYIENLCDFINHCLISEKASKETFLVCDGPSMSVGDFFDLAYKMADRKSKNFYLPFPLLKFMSRWVGKESLLNKLSTACELDHLEFQEKMSWSPKWNTEEGLKETFNLKDRKVDRALPSVAPVIDINTKRLKPETFINKGPEEKLNPAQPYVMRALDNELKVSVITPCRNEANHIARVLDNVLEQNYPAKLLEIIVVDGMSTDNTSEVIQKYESQYSNIKYFKNDKKITSHAMNIGIRNAQGDIIIRMDAHSIYPKNYVSRLVEWLVWLDADNVGAGIEAQPAVNSLAAHSIAQAVAHPFGVENAQLLLDTKNAKPVDSVPLGCFWKSVFSKIGYYDEDLVRGHDDELNNRLKRAGGKIFLVPDLKTQYFPRETFTKAWKMYFQYGYCRPFINKKLGQIAQLKQLVPLFFLITLSLFIVFSFVNPMFLYAASIAVISYILMATLASLKIVFQSKQYWMFPLLVFTFAGIHLSYGWGFIKGFWDTNLMGRVPIRVQDRPLSR